MLKGENKGENEKDRVKLLCVEQNVPRNLNIYRQANIIPAVKEEKILMAAGIF